MWRDSYCFKSDAVLPAPWLHFPAPDTIQRRIFESTALSEIYKPAGSLSFLTKLRPYIHPTGGS